MTREKGPLDEVHTAALVTAVGGGEPQHRAEGDASRSSSQGGDGGAQVNTLKSSSWDRWGVSHDPPPPPSTHTVKQSERRDKCDRVQTAFVQQPENKFRFSCFV